MDITWSEISVHLGTLATNANVISLVVGGGGLTLFRDHLVTPSYVETEQKTLRAVLQVKLAEKHRQVLNWHGALTTGLGKPQISLTAVDAVQEYANEIFRGAILIRRLERIHLRARRARACMFICTIAALVGFLGSLAFDAVKPFFFMWAVVLLIIQIITVVRSLSCKTELDGANEAA